MLELAPGQPAGYKVDVLDVTENGFTLVFVSLKSVEMH